MLKIEHKTVGASPISQRRFQSGTIKIVRNDIGKRWSVWELRKIWLR